jgi:hypothetical protein
MNTPRFTSIVLHFATAASIASSLLNDGPRVLTRTIQKIEHKAGVLPFISALWVLRPQQDKEIWRPAVFRVQAD